MSDLFEHIEAGDKVVLGHSYTIRRNKYVFAVVDRTTKTQIIVGEKRFRRADGRQVGERAGYSGSSILLLTPESQKQVEETLAGNKFEHAVYKIRDVKWQDYTIEQLNEVLDIAGDQ